MARRKKRARRHDWKEEPRFELNPETKRGIAIIVLYALGALLFLSFFDIAGSLGTWIDNTLAQFLGWDRFLLPLLLCLIAATMMYPERGRFSGWNFIGMLFFFLSFNGLINILLVNSPEASLDELVTYGGYLGQFLATLLPSFIGFWGAIVVISAILLVSVMLLFNTSLRRIIGVHTHLTGRFGAWLHRDRLPPERGEGVVYQEDIEVEGKEGFEGEEADEEETERAFRKKEMKGGEGMEEEGEEERVLTTRTQRKVTIPMDLLDRRTSRANSGDIERNKEIISRTLQQFGIDVEMGETSTGPTITQYTLRPSQGVKLARILGLQNDLALALAAHPIRIEAPIPGKSLVGIEVPNQTVATVSLRDLLESKAFANRKTNLSVPLGKDVMGNSWVVPLDKMPHMLVAGATGSGKSVCMNTMIISLLYENGPDELRFIMIDPKRVELTIYEGIPHLLIPPITKVDDTVNALKWTVREMERRLDVLSRFGARDINSYNAKAEEKMPKIVVMIDELADLMSASGREVEAAIVRIAQMARATGIHLVLATQRPSVDVITGLIKANIPARLAFSVASQTDSRTILDLSGAEKLLGRGDMLFTSPELSKPKRLQGPFVSEEEVSRVVEFLKKENVPDYNYAITEQQKSGTIFGNTDDDDDPLLEDAIRVILESRKASTSLLQRRIKVGYARAARIIDLLEEKGVVGPGEGAKPREVLIDEWPVGGGPAFGRDPANGGDLTEGLPTAENDYEEAEEQGSVLPDDEEQRSADDENVRA
jgi:S-DNA-T family DNA segregation ATPase FtsK/SpoIIIE